MRAASRKLLVVVLGLLVLGFVLYRLSGSLHLAGFSGAKVLHAVRGANPYYLLLSLVAIYACYALRSLRWKVFQKNLGASHFWRIYGSTVAGFAAIFLLGRAGEPVRPLLLARKENLPVADTFGIYVLERLFDMASTAVIAAIGLLLFQAQSHTGETSRRLETAARTTGALLFAGLIGAVAMLVYLRLHGTALLQRGLHRWLHATGWRATVARIVLGFARGVQTIRTWTDLALAIFYSGAHWFLVTMVYLWVSHSFAGTLQNITLSDAMLVLAFTLVGSTVQLPGVGGGSQAGSIIAYTAIYGVEREPAVAAAMVLWLITFAACSLAGVPILIHEGWSLGDLKRMAKEEKKQEAAVLESEPIREIRDSKEVAGRSRRGDEIE
ncbi:MAG TPA: lysylphosphatidylglycerol synthase transmembrane domain-containing protein [Candidatus Dormibacteraeota bacterium]|nr:lysylphosphatidylglycerol synthase transmembrane domain-containing protein [Candidatus Dormibacteraeota bacterium]